MDQKKIGRLVIFWLFMIAAIMIFQQAACPKIIRNDLAYGDFISEVERSNIHSVIYKSDGEISGKLINSIDGTSDFTTQVINPSAEFIEFQRKIILEHNPNAIVDSELIQTGFLSTLFSWFPLFIIIGVWIFFMYRMSPQTGGQGGLSAFGKSKAKLSSNTQKKVTFKDVAGIEEAKEELQEIVDFLREPQKFLKLGGRIPKGVLLMGSPGTGKTLLARAVAGEANVPFFSISGSDFVEMFVGVGASRVRDLFEQGKKNAPCIVFIDEIDAVGRHRGAGLGGGHDEREQTLNALLVELDGFGVNEGVIIIGATNRPDVLDPALLRPGRFDRRVVVNKPDIKGRKEILQIHTSKIPVDNSVDLEVIARGSVGFSGADLANLVNEAALNAARTNKTTVDMEHFEFAKDKVLMGGERRSMVISDKEKQITAIHEAGHAYITLQIPGADPLHKVTIIARGMALGITHQLPIEDVHNYSKDYMLGLLKILMGGRCAEEILLGEISTGASNDIERATEIAKRMVREWGMSEKMGNICYGNSGDSPFLGRDFTRSVKDYSEQTAKEIDDEVKKLVDKATDFCKSIIKKEKETVNNIAQELLKREVLSGEQIKKIVSGESLDEKLPYLPK